ncbi:MAG: hypothetical protein U0821_17560 [Chloroflexota bacterium]
MIDKPFDTTTRQLIEADPSAWLRLAGLRVERDVSIVDSDISTSIAMVDKVLRVERPRPWLAHLEVQTSRDPRLLDRVALYYALLSHRHRLPTRSIIVLARPTADGPELDGVLEHRDVDGAHRMTLRYDVVRIWQQPATALLQGDLATLPLAPLADLGSAPVTDVVQAMGRRLESEATIDQRRTLWTATYLLMGLRYNASESLELLKGVLEMRDSVTYQAILEEGRSEGLSRGRAEGVRIALLRFGTHRFGPPTAAIASRLAAIEDLTTLDRLADRMFDASGWDDLLG